MVNLKILKEIKLKRSLFFNNYYLCNVHKIVLDCEFSEECIDFTVKIIQILSNFFTLLEFLSKI